MLPASDFTIIAKLLSKLQKVMQWAVGILILLAFTIEKLFNKKSFLQSWTLFSKKSLQILQIL